MASQIGGELKVRAACESQVGVGAFETGEETVARVASLSQAAKRETTTPSVRTGGRGVLADLLIRMECSVCFDVYDVDVRRPKVLPCGHTFCLPCLQNPNFGNECPQDRKAFRDNPMNFPDNFALLAEMPARADEPWCETCGLRFRGACADAAHRPCSVRQRRVRQEQRQADQQVLQDLQEGLQNLQLGLQDVQREMQDMRQTQDQLLRKVEDLQLPGAAAPPPPSLEIDVRKLSPSEKNDLLVGDRLARVRKLTGLHCYNVERSMAVLMKLNPHVEELGLIGAQLPQLRFVEGMTSLRKLDLDVSSLIEHAESYEIPDLPLQLEELEVEGFSRNHLKCLPELRKLRRLVLGTQTHDTFDFSGLAWQCGLQYLNVATPSLPTIVSLVRAHAATLEELEVHGALRPGPWFHKDLPTKLHACGLLALRRLTLRRHKFQHQSTSCSRQLSNCKELFGPTVEVRCTVCS